MISNFFVLKGHMFKTSGKEAQLKMEDVTDESSHKPSDSLLEPKPQISTTAFPIESPPLYNSISTAAVASVGDMSAKVDELRGNSPLTSNLIYPMGQIPVDKKAEQQTVVESSGSEDRVTAQDHTPDKSLATADGPVSHDQAISDEHQVDQSGDDGAADPSGLVNAVRRLSTAIPETPGVSNLLSLTNWTLDQFKHTKQVVMEKLGKAERSHDPELEAGIERLEQLRSQYLDMMHTCEALLRDMVSASRNQALLSAQFEAMAENQDELASEFHRNAHTMQVIASHAEPLITAMKFFIANVATLCEKTMEDTLWSIGLLNAARVDYDVLRLEREAQGLPLDDAELNSRKAKYEKARESVVVKMGLLDENRLKVLRKQLLVFNNAMVAYYSSNEDALVDAIAQIGRGYDAQPD